MVKLFTLSAALLVTSAAFAAPAPATAKAKFMEQQNSRLFRYAHQPQVKDGFVSFPGTKAKVAANPEATTLPSGDNLNYLLSPKDEVWFYTMNEVYEEVKHESWTERVIKGFDLTVYDADLKELGKVHDMIELEGDQTSIRRIMVDTSVSQKFFNSDNNYEIIVSVAAGNAEYSVDYYSLAYSIGATADANGNTPRLCRMDGYVSAAINAPRDAWSEDYYYTFITEGIDEKEVDEPTDEPVTQDELGDAWSDIEKELIDNAARSYIKLTTYRKGGWSGSPQEIGAQKVYLPNQPGDQQNTPAFMSTVKNGVPTFIVSYYEKWFFSNAIGPGFNSDPEYGKPFKDNNLIVDVYTYTVNTPEMVLKQSTKVFADQEDSDPDVYMCYYGIGNLTFDGDLNEDGSLIITKMKYLLSDDDSTLNSYYRYTSEGEMTDILAEDVSGFMYMSDLPGHEPQVMFITLNESTSNPDGSLNPATGVYSFVNLESGEPVCEIPSTYGSFMLKANVDRYPAGKSYEYAFETVNGYYDENGNGVEQIAWFDEYGEMTHVDKLVLGKNIALSSVYISSGALNPYLFDTNAAREYMWLVKRYTGNSSATQEELVVLNTEGETIFSLGPDSEKGNLAQVSLINENSNPKLCVIYQDASYNLTSEFYELPLTKFAQGGDGTEANPYKIASYGDFAEVGKDPAAWYEFVADVDAAGCIWNPVTATFTGHIKGNGHSVTGLTVGGRGFMFSNLGNGAEISDLSFISSKINAVSSNSALIAGNTMGAKLTGVHVYGLEFVNEETSCTFGGLVGVAALGTVISDCSVHSALINLPKSDAVGGIVGDIRTGSSINMCSVSGSITGGTQVGGVVGAVAKDTPVSNCHVDADIVALNTVGGIAGYSEGGIISRCYVEGSVKATGGSSSYVDNGPCAGGVVGSLAPRYSNEDVMAVAAEVPASAVVANNFVNLAAIEGYVPAIAERWPNQQNTLHRIVGKSRAQSEPEIEDYDQFDEPIYGAAQPEDDGLANNYAVETLPLGKEDAEAAHTTAEGATVAADKLAREWFESELGFAYGEGNAWNELTDEDPALNHETVNFCTPSEVITEVGKTFKVSVVFVGRELKNEDNVLEDFEYEFDENIVAMTGVADMNGNVLSIEFEALAAGTTDIKFFGTSCNVIVQPNAGVGSVVAPGSNIISVDAAGIHASGCRLAVYNASGIQVAAGNGFISTSGLVRGIYVATATDADGNAQSVKFIVR